MSMVKTPVTSSDFAEYRANGATVWAMEIGQHVIVVLLTMVSMLRSISIGVQPVPVIIAGVSLLVWHTAGAYISARTGSARAMLFWLLGFVAVWIGAVIISAEFMWLAFLLWLLTAHLLTVGWGILLSLLYLVVVVVAPLMHYDHTTYAQVFGPLIGMVFAFGIARGYLRLLREAASREQLVASLKTAQAEMAELQDELATAQRESGVIQERTRISRDLHDTVAQSLSSIRLLAHAQANQPPESTSATATLEQIEALASESLTDVRRIVEALAPAELEDAALASALERMLARLQEQTGVHTRFHVDDTLPGLGMETEVALLRTAQSALANVRLHAQANNVVVSLNDAEDTVRLDIIDDGVGFDTTAWETAAQVSSTSFGLAFMRTRLRELGGGIDVSSQPGEGTEISAHLPIHHPQPRKDQG